MLINKNHSQNKNYRQTKSLIVSLRLTKILFLLEACFHFFFSKKKKQKENKEGPCFVKNDLLN